MTDTDTELDFAMLTPPRSRPVVTAGKRWAPVPMRLGVRNEPVCTPYPDGIRMLHAGGVFFRGRCLFCGGAR